MTDATEARPRGDYLSPAQRGVAAFHRAFDHPDSFGRPRVLTPERGAVRCEFIREEAVDELGEAVVRHIDPENEDAERLLQITDIIDALVDAVYFALGTAVEMGVEISSRPARRLPHEFGTSQRSTVHRDALADLPERAGRARYSIERRLPELQAAFADAQIGRAAYVIDEIVEDCLDPLHHVGIGFMPFFDEVQASNMSKLGPDGKAIKSRGLEIDGAPLDKVLKGPNYFAPDLPRIYRELYLETAR